MNHWLTHSLLSTVILAILTFFAIQDPVKVLVVSLIYFIGMSLFFYHQQKNKS